jgi:hypothetical protein
MRRSASRQDRKQNTKKWRNLLEDHTPHDPDLARGYAELLAEASATGRPMAPEQIESRRALGRAAAEHGIALSTVVDLYLTATRDAWPELPGVRAAQGVAELNDIAVAILRTAQDATVAITEGYESGRRSVIRREEAARREFIEDLLSGHADLGQLAERAQRFGFRLVGPHQVAVARSATAFVEGEPATRYVADAMATLFGTRDVLITAKDGLLVCLAAGSAPEVVRRFSDHVHGADREPALVAVSRVHPGPDGIVRCYLEARHALDLAARLGLTAPLIDASDLLVFHVIGRDRAAITDLVSTVLGPLERARGGGQPLLDTLTAYFACGCVNAATARSLGLSVRAVTYRLNRIRQLTGYDPIHPDQRYTLQTAVLGARLLDWPTQPLQPGT